MCTFVSRKQSIMSILSILQRITYLTWVTLLIFAGVGKCYAITTDDSIEMSFQDTISVNSAVAFDRDTATVSMEHKELTVIDLALDLSHLDLPDSIAIDTLSAMSITSKPGRFTLYPTQNRYNFILLDQTDGRTWQVQWSTKPEEVGLWRIQ